MSFKFEIRGSALVVTDTVTSIPKLEAPKRDVYINNYELLKGNVAIYDTSAVNASGSNLITFKLAECVDENSVAFTEDSIRLFMELQLTSTTLDSSTPISVSLSTNDLGVGAFGRPKVIQDRSILHGLFTYNIPNTKWYEVVNGVEQVFTNATSVNGKLNLVSGATLNDITYLRTFRNPRYEPNRGQIYSSSEYLPNPSAIGNRSFGTFTAESGTFFKLKSGVLHAVIRTTVNSVTTDDEYLIDITGIDLSKGRLYDIQYEWRGVGDYKFFIDLKLVKTVIYDGMLTELSSFNPALPIAFECENLGDNVVIECGCVDVSTEGGDESGKTYGSIGMTSESGQVSISGFNVPIIAIRSKDFLNGLINTRDTLALLATGYADQRAFLRVWATRDATAVTENDQSWTDYGDGNLEFMTYDQPDVGTPMSFDTSKASLIFGSRVDQDQSYSTSALFEGRTNIYLTPNDIFVFTMHRETGQSCNVGVTFEFAEDI